MEVEVAAAPDPVTRSRVINVVGGVPVGAEIVGSAPDAPVTAGKALASLVAVNSGGAAAGEPRLSGCEVHPLKKMRAVMAQVVARRP